MNETVKWHVIIFYRQFFYLIMVPPPRKVPLIIGVCVLNRSNATTIFLNIVLTLSS